MPGSLAEDASLGDNEGAKHVLAGEILRLDLRLDIVQVPVESVATHQLLVGANLGDAVLIEHNNGISAANGGQAVSDHNRRSTHHEPLQGLLD